MTAHIGDGTTTLTPLLLTGWESNREGRNVLHTIVGSEVPEVTLRDAGLRSGEFTFLFTDVHTAIAAEQLASQAKALWMNDDNGDFYIYMDFVVSGAITVAIDEESRELWTVTIEFQEI